MAGSERISESLRHTSKPSTLLVCLLDSKFALSLIQNMANFESGTLKMAGPG